MTELKNGDRVYISTPDKEWVVVGTNPQSGSIVCLRDGYCDYYKSFHSYQLKMAMSDEEKAGKRLWELSESVWAELNGGSGPEWRDMEQIVRDIWVEMAKRVTINE